VECRPCPAGTVVVPGQGDCRPCGAGSAPSPDVTFCVPNCSVTVGGRDYDLQRLNRGISSTLPDECDGHEGPAVKGCDADYEYSLQLCAGEGQPKNYNCYSWDDDPEFKHAFACQSNYRRASSWVVGANRSVTHNPATGSLSIVYDEGKFCASAGARRRTVVAMTCDLKADLDEPELLYRGEDPACTYNFEFSGLQACPLCTLATVDVERTACENGTRRVRHHRRENCSLVHLPPRTESCPLCDSAVIELCDAQYRRLRRTVYTSNASCWTPGNGTDTLLGRCAQVNVDEANAFTIALAALVGFLLLLLVAVSVVSLRNRRLTHAYQQLSQRPGAGGDVELLATDEIFGDDLDDHEPTAAAHRSHRRALAAGRDADDSPH